MQKLAVVYFPKINLDEINNFRRKYDPNWQIISPHITIVSPISDISENKLVEHIEAITKDVEAFSIHLTGLTKSAFGDCLFLEVKAGNDGITNLHYKLYSGILASYLQTDIPFNPHITLGDNLDNKLYAKAYTEARNLNFDITCYFDAISVIKGDGLSPARIIKTINLHS